MSAIMEVRKMRELIEDVIQDVPVETAKRAVCLHPDFKKVVGKTVGKGFRFQFDGGLWAAKQDNLTILASNVPGKKTENLYEQIK